MSMPFNVEKGTRLDAIVIGANRQATKMIPGLSLWITVTTYTAPQYSRMN